MDQGQSSQATGTRDETYNLVSVLYHALQGAENCQTYLRDVSGDQRLRGFFEQALNQQRQLAEQAKQLLHDRLMQETGGQGSAFRFDEGGSGGSGASGSGGNIPTGQTSGTSTTNPSGGQFGQSAYGQGQRHSEMTTGGGGTSTF